MLLDSYITDAEQERIQKEYCEKIINFKEFREQLVTIEFRKEIQQFLHQIKNIILTIRMNGTEIQRLDQPGDYLRLCSNNYETLKNICRKYRIKQLICMSEVILDQVDWED